MADIKVFDSAPEGTPVANFVHLHVHSDYSLLDSCAKIDKLVAKAKKLNMPALALTDHGNMFGVLNFEHLCHANGINPIVGCEFYSTEDHTVQKPTRYGSKYFHLILLCENETGYKNMCWLNSNAFTDENSLYYGKPRIDFEMLKERHEGLICLSACVAGELPQILMHDTEEAAEEFVKKYSELFGPDHFYIELQDHGLGIQKNLNPKLISLARRMNIPLVVTNDIHYIEKEDAEAQDVLRCIGFQQLLSEPHQTMGEGRSEWYFKTEEEMRSLFPELPDAYENTVKIADMCNLTIHQYSTPELKGCLPRFELPEEFRTHEDYSKNQDDFVRHLVEKGLRKRYSEITPKIRQRAEYELAIIFKMGFSGYFLIVWEFINWAKEHGIPIGPGRGSGAGSIVAYSMEITDIDPIRFNLIFERFLNPERISMPDFDIDMDFDYRQDIIQHTRELYGEPQVGHIVTFGTLKPKLCIADVGRVLGVPLSEVNFLKSLVPNSPKARLKDAFEVSDKFPEGEGGKLAPYRDDPRYKKLFDLAFKLENVNRQTGLHASGMVIGLTELPNWAPVFKDAKTHEVAVQYTMDIIEPCGLVKFDYLGLKTLSLIRYAETIVNKHKKEGEERFETSKVSETDEKTFNMMTKGDSVAVFQFESGGMQKILRDAKPHCLEELIALNALYRPGPMDYIPTYIKGKWDPSSVKYPDPCLEDILKETYGVMVYQEQVMQVSQRIAGFSLGEADMLRRAMGKKKPEVLMGKKKEFEAGAVKKGFTKEHADEIFDIMVPFAGYGFNKSHAAAYSVLAYRTAWLKANKPAEFMAANLTNEINTTDGLPKYIEESRKMGITVEPPDVNRSDAIFDVIDGNIIFGLKGIKGMGDTAARAIVTEREKNGPYTDFMNFLERTIFLKSENDEEEKSKSIKLAVTKKNVELLIKTGAFDKIDRNRQTLFVNLDRAYKYTEKKVSESLFGQPSLFEDTGEKEFSDFVFEEQPDFSTMEKLTIEKELIGCYISGHPLDDYRKAYEAATLNSKNFEREAHFAKQTPVERDRFHRKNYGKQYTTVGMITDIRQITTKKGDQMAFAKLQDYTGEFDITYFPKTWEQLAAITTDGMVTAIKGKIDSTRDTPTFIVDSYESPDVIAQRATQEVHLMLDGRFDSEKQIFDLREFLFGKTGNCLLYFHLETDNGSFTVKASQQFTVPSSSDFIESLKSLPFVLSVWTA